MTPGMATWFRNLSLQRKLLWLVGLAALLSMLMGAAVLIVYEVTTFRPRATEGAAAQVDGLAEVLTAAVEFDDRETAQKHLEAFARQPGVHALAIVLEDGSVFAQYLSAGAQPFSSQPSARAPPPPDAVSVSAPVLAEGRRLADVHMVKELRPFGSRILEYGAILGAGALSLLALTLLLSIMLRRAITAPVEALAQAVEQVASDRNYQLRVATDRSDEVGQLAVRMNEMLAAIEEHDARLRASEETARRQVAEIENLYENSAIGLCLVDRDLRFVRINKLAADLNERTIEDTIGRKTYEVIPEIARVLDPLYRRILETGETVTTEVEHTPHGESEPRFLKSTHYPLRSPAGHIVGITSVLRDVTERRRADVERASLEAQLRQSHKMQALGTLAGGIAHDFNNVLTAISGNARLALEDLPDDHPAAISVGEISRAAARAKDLVRRILAFSRQEQADRRPIALTPVVEEALRLLRATVPTMIDIRFKPGPNLPYVLADATQVHQVLMNLGTNACDAMRERGGVLTVRLDDVRTDTRLQSLTPDLHPGRYVRISVADTGVGMTRELLERIFDPFFTTKAPGEGTGLGLSVVHGIMRSHGGAVLVSSDKDQGSTFDLYFPIAEETADALADPVTPDALAAQGRGEHILYVDDEEALVFLVTRMMQRMGYRITGVQSAAAAIEAVRAAPRDFDLVITDLGMPGMSGMDLSVELLRIRPDLPIIITSGYVRTADLKRAEDIGVRDVVLKPGTVAEMGVLIRQRLGDLTINGR